MDRFLGSSRQRSVHEVALLDLMALAHWIVIEDGKIANYQAVVPSTWNAGPRDPQGKAGPYEAGLKGHRLHDAKQPLEILRTVHSFDPCIACAVHVTDPHGEELIQVKVG